MSSAQKPWRTAVQDEFGKIAFDADEKARLRALLARSRADGDRACDVEDDDTASAAVFSRVDRGASHLTGRTAPFPNGKVDAAHAARLVSGQRKSSLFKRVHDSGAGYFMVGLAAAGIGVVLSGQPRPPATEEQLQAAEPLRQAARFPADFDLEGDASALPEFVQEVLANTPQRFHAEIPEAIRQRFAPGEGRFVSWRGGPGVAVKLSKKGSPSARDPFSRAQERDALARAQAQARADRDALLYILNLPENAAWNDFDFTTDNLQVQRYLGRDDWNEPMKTWRQGNTGYMLINEAR